MSGFAIVYGRPDREAAASMLRAIEHRGGFADGLFEDGRIAMAQAYRRADGAPADSQGKTPVGHPDEGRLRICYDGQMGNWARLASEHGVPAGPFREERLLLQLYRSEGRDMLKYLDDAVFAFAIYDGEDIFAARDLLGIKTLFYGRDKGKLYLSSELKGVLAVTEDVHEFPPGHFMDGKGLHSRFAELPRTRPEPRLGGPEALAAEIRDIVTRSFKNRVDFSVPTGSLLSGGIDSSVIAAVAAEAHRERFSAERPLKTFALGVGETEDIHNARVVAEFLGTEHHERIVDLDRVLAVLPRVIYHLESFDPSLVRSAASNYIISQYAGEQGVEVLLSGEGGDEVFCGYTYLQDFPEEALFEKQIECLGFLHNNASLRLDRMNQCHGLRVVAPLISGELLRCALALPAGYKLKRDGGRSIEKWIFRKAFEDRLPEPIVWRSKQEFSQGSGSARVLPAYFEERITDQDLARARTAHPMVRSKEELHYFRIFTEHFGTGAAVDTVGQWVSL